MAIQPEHRSMLAVDIEGFSRVERTNPIQLALHRVLRQLLDHSLRAAKVDPSGCEWEDRGDGFLLTIPPEVPKTCLLDPLVPHLATALKQHNRSADSARQLRLRLVVHAGEVLRDPQANVGQAVIVACRLLDAPQLRACLAATEAPLVLAVSDWLYQEVVQHGYGRIEPASYHPIQFTGKDLRARAWVHVPGDVESPRRVGILPDGAIWAPSSGSPRELPPSIPEFTGREDELRWLEDLATVVTEGVQTVVISAIDGMGGVGKSTLAIRAAHTLVDRFPDGQLYVNLHGATSGLEPLSPHQALTRLLRSLGVHPNAIPTDLQEAAARWRSLAADRRMLVVLDDARSADQVRPLLPGSSTCSVLVTSRDTLAHLDGVTRMHLDVLPEPQAILLLSRLLGPMRVRDESTAIRRLAQVCGYLPLALQLAGRRLATRPHWTVDEHVRRLSDEHSRLDHLSFRDRAVRASLLISYQALRDEDPQAARAFRLLGLHNGPDFAPGVAAALLAQPVGHVLGLLDRLVDASLLEEPHRERYRFHDLLRLFARTCADDDETATQRRAAIQRSVEWYLEMADAAARILAPQNRRAELGYTCQTGLMLHLGSRDEALAWYESERPNLTAATRQAAACHLEYLAWKVPAVLVDFFNLRKYFDDWITTHQVGLAGARRVHDRYGEAWILNTLGLAYWELRRFDEAILCYQKSLAIRRDIGDRTGEGQVLTNLGAAHRDIGEIGPALECLQLAVQINRHEGYRWGEAWTLDSLGGVYQRIEQPRETVYYFQQALPLRREVDDRYGEGITLDHLGGAYQQLGQLQEAIDHFQQALTVRREVQDLYGEAWTLHNIGEVYRQLGQPPEAINCFQQALTVRREVKDRYGEGITLQHLGLALRQAGHLDEARACLRSAHTLFSELDDPLAAEVLTALDELPVDGED